MPTALHDLATRLLPERQRHYEAACALLAKALAGGSPKFVYSAQQCVRLALKPLNDTRQAAGLAPVEGPRPRSLDELLALPNAAPEALLAALLHAERAPGLFVVARIEDGSHALAA